jgi:hypothetical protein
MKTNYSKYNVNTFCMGGGVFKSLNLLNSWEGLREVKKINNVLSFLCKNMEFEHTKI